MAVLDSVYRGDHGSKITFIVRPLHNFLSYTFVSLYPTKMSTNACYCVQNTLFSNINACFNIKISHNQQDGLCVSPKTAYKSSRIQLGNGSSHIAMKLVILCINF